MNESIVITAGGSGKRMKSALAKQYIEVDGKPILQHTIDRFKAYNPNIFIVIVLPITDIKFWKDLCDRKGYLIDYEIAVGGKERFHSVKQGIKFCPKTGLIGIHDAVRPLVSIQTIENCFETALAKGSGIPVLPVNDSLRRIEGDSSVHVARGQYRIVQTPQCFKAEDIRAAYKVEFESKFTDDASVVEANGGTIHLVDGNTENIKITTPSDLVLAKTYLSLGA